MKIPKKIKILGYTYKVIITEDANKLLVGGNHCYGTCDPIRQEIYLNKDQHEEQILQTLSHEIIHAIDFLTNQGKYDLTEEQTDKLGTGLCSILLYNKVDKWL